MPSRVTYMNQSAPFWDFVASMEQQASNHPFFSQNRDGESHYDHEYEHEHDEGHHPPPPPFGPWGWGQFFGGGRGMPHRGPPPPGPPPHEHGEPSGEKDGEPNDDNDDNDNNGEGPSGESGSDNEGRSRCRGRHGHCGGRRGRHGPGGRGGFGHGGRGGFGPHHGPPHGPPPHHGPGPHHGPPQGPHHGPPHGPPPHHGHGPRHGPGPHHGPPRHGGRGPRGPWGRRGGSFGGGFDPSALAAHFWDQFVNPNATSATTATPATSDSDFSPEADVFDTESAYVIHVSLPGAKKEDVGVNWDTEKSELAIAGVIYRPGDEEFLKTLAMNERKAGPFERKIRLGTRASPAQIDAEGITAKLEDGVLRVEVPKLGETGFVEVKKVDIE